MAKGYAVLAPLLVAMTAVSAAASEAGHEAAHGPTPEAWMGLMFSFLNFAIFAFLIYRYAWPAVRDFLSSRRMEVVDAMALAEQARAETEAIRAEYASKEAALEETRRHMLDEIRQGAASDREKLLREAEAAAKRLREDAERQAEHDLARARRELRAEAAKLAAELAEKEVRARLSDGDRARLVSEFVEGVAAQ